MDENESDPSDDSSHDDFDSDEPGFFYDESDEDEGYEYDDEDDIDYTAFFAPDEGEEKETYDAAFDSCLSSEE